MRIQLVPVHDRPRTSGAALFERADELAEEAPPRAMNVEMRLIALENVPVRLFGGYTEVRKVESLVRPSHFRPERQEQSSVGGERNELDWIPEIVALRRIAEESPVFRITRQRIEWASSRGGTVLSERRSRREPHGEGGDHRETSSQGIIRRSSAERRRDRRSPWPGSAAFLRCRIRMAAQARRTR